MTSAPDDDYIKSLNQHFEPRNDLAVGIAARDRKIKEIDARIAEAREKRVHDPWRYDQQLAHLSRLRGAEILQRASLDFQRRNEVTADADKECAYSSGAVWRNDVA